MVKATNASIVTIGLVFLSLIFSIVGCHIFKDNYKKYC